MLSSISQGHAREAGREGERLHFTEGAPSPRGCAWDISCSPFLLLSSILALNFLVPLLIFMSMLLLFCWEDPGLRGAGVSPESGLTRWTFHME